MEKKRSKTRPRDDILEFDRMQSPRSTKRNDEIIIDKMIEFESLPISGWHDEIDVLDSRCKQSCVKDCSCVYHCTWVIA